ncbi:hypothetical protein AAC387_Pa12g0357 [Persea americana]
MLRGIVNGWWKSVRNSFKEMPNATIWETFKKQFRWKSIPIMCEGKKQNEFLTLQHNQMTMVVYVHTFLQLSKYVEDLINIEEKKVGRCIDGFNPAYVEHVLAFKRPDTFDDPIDSAFSA